MNKSLKQMGMPLIANQETSLELEPADRTFDFPAVTIAAKTSAILSRSFLSAFAMRCHLLDTANFQSVSDPVSIRSLVVEQAVRTFPGHADVDECFNRVDFRSLGRRGESRNRNSLTIGHQHQLCALALFGLTHFKTLFFAGEKVPSPIACDQSSIFRRSIKRISCSHASSMSPASVQSRCRRLQVEEEGYRCGKSCHRAPVFRTHRIPSRHARESTLGRSPSGEESGLSNRSLMRFHWESLRNGCEAVLDPVVFGRRRFGHMHRVMII